ncbi:uncharacterized protein LOC109811106 isoform X2 [Cajanus cajan]|uniref:uncharacterized protein LOC109811187 isoform X2 n=1 Tax=Cajanus cajan TaxID=3821 RepID=UPI0010FB09C3|nr:uncharacterized protein LOC109811187 isoform X2 [Cajanus cajan]XP_029129757.1 uncharacterized protein LOC109811106 isoform X2 [Cajanus cajan]
MNTDDRKRRFNEGIVNMLYPSPPPLPEPFTDDSRSDVISGTLDGYDDASTSGDSETEKLTRAQRKKIRKKKLKEETTHRGKLIGPLLPLRPTQAGQDAPPVRSNASEEGAKSVKVKNRRMAKRLAKEKPSDSTSENTNQSSAPL